ncbi:neprilysin-2-like isoform X2 [Photinus pyralis]|uniref:neprilysin-2-like isoform X2 n=1 Tax=Photinus pyralis TaxID=7054 RepID=UPI00126744A4|nr:neprilysin-2-like isoform X2 [Photinus pyralis]
MQKDLVNNGLSRNPSCRNRPTTMKRCPILVSTVICYMTRLSLISVVIALYIKTDGAIHAEVMASSQPILNLDSLRNVCTTPACLCASSSILNNMDPSVDPCDDFHEFVCGNYLKTTNIPDDQHSIGTMNKVNELLQTHLRYTLEENINPSEPKPFFLAKQLYAACMNVTAIELDGLTTAKSLLKEFGGWPLLGGPKLDREKFDSQSLCVFLNFEVQLDHRNTSRNVIYVSHASSIFFSPYPYSMIEKYLEHLSSYMVDIAVIFGASKVVAEKEFVKVFRLAEKLHYIKKNIKCTVLTLMSVSKLQHKFPGIPWLKYFNHAFNLPDTRINMVYVCPAYILEVEKLLKITSKRTQVNYFMWKIVSTMVVPHLTKHLRERELNYTSLLSGRVRRQPRWKQCVDVVAQGMPLATGALYVRRYFRLETKRQAMEMVSDIKGEFVNILKRVDWLDNTTKNLALEKTLAMVSHVAYPDEILLNKNLEAYYEGLNFTSENYLDMRFRLKLFGRECSAKSLRLPINKTDWTTHADSAVVNAFYRVKENSIQIPAGILQGAYFSIDRPQFMNYGGIGTIIGHEIIHAFDSKGVKYDKDGKRSYSWSSSAMEALELKKTCLVNQYEKYTIPELKVNLNGVQTLAENIADNGGFRVAYLAYKRWVKRNGEEQRLPILNYTDSQLFWISAATSQGCSKGRVEHAEYLFHKDPHSPGNVRVNFPLANTDYFADDFNCPEGSKMNPVDKCMVWK